ncbi:hypothetical protein Pfo_019406, partial [Paulownia fortunei]
MYKPVGSKQPAEIHFQASPTRPTFRSTPQSPFSHSSLERERERELHINIQYIHYRLLCIWSICSSFFASPSTSLHFPLSESGRSLLLLLQNV